MVFLSELIYWQQETHRESTFRRQEEKLYKYNGQFHSIALLGKLF
jgi:hypothetical protein